MAWVTATAPMKLVRRVRSSAPICVVVGGPSAGSAMPALLTRTSSEGMVAAAAATVSDVDLLGAQGCGGLFAEREVACAEQNGEAGLAELACHFEADAFVGSGDEGCLGLRCHVVNLLVNLRLVRIV
jgi:hypothetical protein